MASLCLKLIQNNSIKWVVTTIFSVINSILAQPSWDYCQVALLKKSWHTFRPHIAKDNWTVVIISSIYILTCGWEVFCSSKTFCFPSTLHGSPPIIKCTANSQQYPNLCFRPLKKFLMLRSKSENGNRLFIYMFKHSYKKRIVTYVYFNQAGHTFQIPCSSLFWCLLPLRPYIGFTLKTRGTSCWKGALVYKELGYFSNTQSPNHMIERILPRGTVFQHALIQPNWGWSLKKVVPPI